MTIIDRLKCTIAIAMRKKMAAAKPPFQGRSNRIGK
jgi:hypothetical protein